MRRFRSSQNTALTETRGQSLGEKLSPHNDKDKQEYKDKYKDVMELEILLLMLVLMLLMTLKLMVLMAPVHQCCYNDRV